MNSPEPTRSQILNSLPAIKQSLFYSFLGQGVVFQSYDLHAGTDFSGVPTKMLTINSTVRIAFRNSGTFFGLHAWSTTLEMNYSELKIASGYVSLSEYEHSIPTLILAG